MGMFDEYLDRKAEDIKAPPLLPPGTYLAQVKSHPERKDTPEWEFLEFSLVVVEPDEVDEEELAGFGKVAGFPIRHSFGFSKKPDDERSRELSLNGLKTFLTSLGIEFEGSMSLGEAIAQSPGCQAVVKVSHRPDKADKSKVFLNVDATYAID